MMIIKQGDTHNAIQSQLIKDGLPINLDGCTVEILISNIQDECIIVNAEQGRVAYPVSAISQKQGFYSYEFIIKYKDGTQETVPNNSYEKIRVFENLKE